MCFVTSYGLDERPEVHSFIEGLQLVYAEDEDECSSWLDAELPHGWEVVWARSVDYLHRVEQPIWQWKSK